MVGPRQGVSRAPVGAGEPKAGEWCGLRVACGRGAAGGVVRSAAANAHLFSHSCCHLRGALVRAAPRRGDGGGWRVPAWAGCVSSVVSRGARNAPGGAGSRAWRRPGRTLCSLPRASSCRRRWFGLRAARATADCHPLRARCRGGGAVATYRRTGLRSVAGRPCLMQRTARRRGTNRLGPGGATRVGWEGSALGHGRRMWQCEPMCLLT